MMQKRGRLLAPEQPREADLPAGRRKQILAANHEIDSLAEIVDGDRELIRPVAEAIADQDVSALRRGVQLPGSEAAIDELLDARIQPHAPAVAIDQRQPTAAAVSVV